MVANKCGIGYSCGETCIQRTKQCRANTTVSTSENLDKFSEAILAHTARKSPTFEEMQKYFSGDDYVIFEQNQGVFKDKVAAIGIQSYFGIEYQKINRYFYDKDFAENEATEDIRMKAEAAKYGFNQLPSHSIEEIQNHYKEKNVYYDGKSLFRGMSFESQRGLNSFLDMHKEGSIVSYPSFTSTSLANPNDSKDKKVNGNWGSKPVQITIKQKDNTAGKWVDQRKRSVDEGEILFPVGQKFKVVKIEAQTREKLPSRLHDPLQSIFESSSEGKGIKNLPIKAMLGDKTPQEFLDSPDFNYFKPLLKKNLPDHDTWKDLPISSILRIDKIKGGRFSFMNELVKALSNQVKPEERTGETEVSSLKIHLEEL